MTSNTETPFDLFQIFQTMPITVERDERYGPELVEALGKATNELEQTLSRPYAKPLDEGAAEELETYAGELTDSIERARSRR
jgi:hypothetical protein